LYLFNLFFYYNNIYIYVNSETQNKQLEKALNIMNHFPKDNIEFRSCWYWIIPCMKYGSLIIDYLEKKMTINMCSSGKIYIYKLKYIIKAKYS